MKIKTGMYLFFICTTTLLQGMYVHPTKIESLLTITSIKNNTKNPITLYDGTKKIAEIPIAQTVYLSRQFVLETKGDVNPSKNLKIAGFNSHAQLIVIQRPRINHTVYGYIIYKEIPGDSPKKTAQKMKWLDGIGKQNQLSIMVNGHTRIQSLQMTLESTDTAKQIEIEKE